MILSLPLSLTAAKEGSEDIAVGKGGVRSPCQAGRAGSSPYTVGTRIKDSSERLAVFREKVLLWDVWLREGGKARARQEKSYLQGSGIWTLPMGNYEPKRMRPRFLCSYKLWHWIRK